jgi:hypothetical protein
MNEPWYQVVPAGTPLTQGDVLRDCRVLFWKPPQDSVTLQDWVEERIADVIVMTQACDLENHKVSNVVLCPLFNLSAYRTVWEARMRQRNQNPSEKAWRGTLKDIADGYVWNQSLLDRHDDAEHGCEVAVVEFQEVYTVPRVYLESLYTQRGKPRLRLNPPYREHLSQSFARFFMRVGLPVPISMPD